MQNEAKIIEKHKIPCSRTYIQEGFRNLREIKNNDEYNKEAMQQIEKLLKAQHYAHKKGKGR